MASPGNQLCVNCIGTLSFPLSRANLCLKKIIRMASITLCYLKLIIEIHILKPVSLWIMESICRWSLLGWYQCFWVSFSTLMLIWHQDCKNLPSFHLRTTGIKQNRKSSSDENGCCTGRGVFLFYATSKSGHKHRMLKIEDVCTSFQWPERRRRVLKSKSRCEHKTSCFIYDQFSRRCIKLDPIRISRCALCRTVYNQQQNDVQWAISPPCLLVHGVAPSSSGPIKAIISGVQHMCAAPHSDVFYCCWEAPRRTWAVGNARKADTCELRGSQTSSSMCSSWRLQDKHLLSVKHLTP